MGAKSMRFSAHRYPGLGESWVLQLEAEVEGETLPLFQLGMLGTGEWLREQGLCWMEGRNWLDPGWPGCTVGHAISRSWASSLGVSRVSIPSRQKRLIHHQYRVRGTALRWLVNGRL
jgi:hypothetical protein